MQKLVPIMVIILALGLMGSNLAYADYIDYINFRIIGNDPLVCLFEAEDEKVKFHEKDLYNKTVGWISEWSDQLNDYTGTDNWNFKYTYIPNATHYDAQLEDYPECNVMIVWDPQNPDTSSGTLGWTSWDHSKSIHKFAFINIYTHAFSNRIILDPIMLGEETGGIIEFDFGMMKREAEPMSDEALKAITQHEFGHALALLHKTQTLTNNFEALMADSLNPWSENISENFIIREADLEAVVLLYGEKGFKSYYDPMPAYGYGWEESVLRGTSPLSGEFLIKFPELVLQPAEFWENN